MPLFFSPFHVLTWVCAFRKVGTCAWVCICTWRPVGDVECLPQLPSAIFFESGHVAEPRALWFGQDGWPMSSRDLSVSSCPRARAGLIHAHHYTWLLTCVLASKLHASCLRDRHFTNIPIFYIYKYYICKIVLALYLCSYEHTTLYVCTLYIILVLSFSGNTASFTFPPWL